MVSSLLNDDDEEPLKRIKLNIGGIPNKLNVVTNNYKTLIEALYFFK